MDDHRPVFVSVGEAKNYVSANGLLWSSDQASICQRESDVAKLEVENEDKKALFGHDVRLDVSPERKTLGYKECLLWVTCNITDTVNGTGILNGSTLNILVLFDHT
jgi:hypothetical protein